MAVSFDEASHTYTSDKGENYISVTTLISKYTPPFDAHFWSTYKAVKAVLEKYGEWNSYKAKAGGWENVVAYVRHVDKAVPHKEEIMLKKMQILQGWDEEKNSAAAKGTTFHKERDAADKATGTTAHGGVIYNVATIRQLEVTSPDGVYPELLIYDDEWKLAGQADWVLKVGSQISIKDYKTSKDIKKSGFQSEMLYHPVSHIPNANFWKFTLQLSLYGAMLERRGFQVKDLWIEHVTTGEDHVVDYYKNEAEELIKHWIETKRKKAA